MNKGNLKLSESQIYRVTGDPVQVHGLKPHIEFDFSNTSLYEKVGQRYKKNPIALMKLEPVSHKDNHNVTDSFLTALQNNHNQRVNTDPEIMAASENMNRAQLEPSNIKIYSNIDVEIYEVKSILFDYIKVRKNSETE